MAIVSGGGRADPAFYKVDLQLELLIMCIQVGCRNYLDDFHFLIFLFRFHFLVTQTSFDQCSNYCQWKRVLDYCSGWKTSKVEVKQKPEEIWASCIDRPKPGPSGLRLNAGNPIFSLASCQDNIGLEPSRSIPVRPNRKSIYVDTISIGIRVESSLPFSQVYHNEMFSKPLFHGTKFLRTCLSNNEQDV